MRQHPTTPMLEADLRRHLGLQGLEPMAGLHYPLYAQAPQVQDDALAALLRAGVPSVLLDVAQPADLASVGRLLWNQAAQRRLLAVGPSSVAQALVAHWQAAGGIASSPLSAPALAPADGPVLVIAGSLSPVTAQQVQAATSYERLWLQPRELADTAATQQACERITGLLAQGRHVLACTAPDDGAPADTSRTGAMAAATAAFARRVLDACAARGRPLRRVGLAGGDTSSLATRALGPWGLSYRGHLGAGVAVVRTHADEPALDGIELMLKGGQMGGPDVFEQLLGRR